MKRLLIFISFCFCLPIFAKTAERTLALEIQGIDSEPLVSITQKLEALHQTNALKDMSIDALQSQIHEALQPYGYFKAQVQIESNHQNKLLITINKGPRVIISQLSITLIGEGRNDQALQNTLQQLPLKTGMPLLTEQYSTAKQQLISTAENEGYLRSSFKKANILINLQTNSAQITLLFDTGQRLYFGPVRFYSETLSPAFLQRYVPFKTGEPYSQEKFLFLNTQLSNSPYFKRVTAKPEIGAGTSVPIAVETKPVPKVTYTLSAGYGTDTGLRGRAGMQVVPINNKGHTLNTLIQGSMTQNLLQAQYRIPGKNPNTSDYSITGKASTLNYDSGYSNAGLVSVNHRQNLSHLQRNLSINGLIERFYYNQQQSTEKNLLFPKANFNFNNRVSPLFSPSGYSVSLNVLGAYQDFFSDLSFIQTTIDAKAAYTIEPIALRVYVHGLFGITQMQNINQLPLSLATLLGGVDTLKGYAFNSIGPGKYTQYLGIELQKETFRKWYLLTFFDAGTVYNPDARIMNYDIGVGLMWVSPIGPIKLGLAQPVDNALERIGGNNPRLFIQMGTDL